MGTQSMNLKKGFTLIELLVVIAIIGLLSAVVLASLNTARAKGRDAVRQSELTTMRNALELYYSANSNYPSGCWNYYEKDGASYIPGLAPTYMPTLPRDPSTGQSCPGGIGDNSNHRTYYYCSNGSAYKLNVCSESVVPTSNPMYDLFRPGYAFMVCSGEPACSTF